MNFKIAFDSTLFSEHEKYGNNSNGMIRLSYEIFKKFAENKNLEFFFYNPVFNSEYHEKLISFIIKEYSIDFLHNVISEKPFLNLKKIESSRFYFKFINNLLKINNNINIEPCYNIFHSFYHPFNSKINKLNVKKCITFLDIIPLKLNGYDSLTINTTKEIVSSIKYNYGISISQFSKDDLLSYDSSIDSERVFVSHLAANDNLFFQNKDLKDWDNVRFKYNLPDDYFLLISSSDSRKNIIHVIFAYREFVLSRKEKKIKLVIAGNFNTTRIQISKLNLEREVLENIIFPNTFIDNFDLSVIYSNSLCFIFMSLYEGFGLPVLEAMNCGTPVITSNTTSMPEVIGDAGISIIPSDQDLLINSMIKIADSKELQKLFSEKSLERSKMFSWEKTSNDYLKFYKTILNS